jgi:hypothetical protein
MAQRGNDGSRSQTGDSDKSDWKIGSGKQVNVPDRAKKDKPEGSLKCTESWLQTLISRRFAPFFTVWAAIRATWPTARSGDQQIFAPKDFYA